MCTHVVCRSGGRVPRFPPRTTLQMHERGEAAALKKALCGGSHRMSSKEGVDALVREYLLSRGYNKAAAELDMEAATAPAAVGASNAIVTKHLLSTVAEDLYILGLKDRNTESYFNGYDSLRTWAVNSVDMVKNQLLSICFPIFVHCYLGLVRLGFHEDAREFLSQFRNDHVEFYSQELQQLCAITSQDQYHSAEQIAANQFVSAALAGKFVVRLSSLAYNLLSLFLVQSDLVLVASIINNKISFKKLDDARGTATNGACEDMLLVELPGYTAGTKASASSDFVPVPLGVPGTVPKIQHLLGTPSTNITLAAAHISLPQSKDDSTYRELISKIVRPKSVLSSLAKRQRQAAVSTAEHDEHAEILLDNAEKLGAFSIEAAVEVRELADVKEEGGEDGAAGANKPSARDGKKEGPGQLTRGVALEPSVIFATVTNAYEGMICLDMNPTLTQMATGHRDSSVRVWRLNPEEDEPHFGKLLNTRNRGGDWTMQNVLPKTRRMMEQDAAAAARSSSGAYSGNSVASSRSGKASGGLPMLELRGHSRAVYGVSQDCSRGSGDRLVLSCSADETIRLWDTAVSQCVGKYTCVSPPWAVAFSPLGYHFASANQDKTGTVFATDRVTPLRVLAGHVSDVNCVAWHGNATLLATGSDDRTARLWDVRSSQSVRLLRGSSTSISCTAISPLGNLLAAGSDGGKIYVWDLTTTRPLAVLQGHEGAVHAVAFSSDGATLSSGGADCAVRVWDLHEVIDTQIKLMPSANTPHTAPAHSNSAGSSSARTGTGASSSLQNVAKTAHLDAPQLLLRPHNSYFTKFSPVFHVGFTPQNLLYAGGPFSLVTATSSTLGGRGSGGSSEAAGGASVNEQDTVSALGIAHAVQAAH